MKKILLALGVLFFVVSCTKENLRPLKIVTLNGEVTYYVEVADTDSKRQRGLMKRTKLAPDSGMIFLFDDKHPQPVAMWMKNTFISLDMLFLSEDFKIIAIVSNTTPMSLNIIQPTQKPVAAVIELNAGQAKKHHLKIGDSVVLMQ